MHRYEDLKCWQLRRIFCRDIYMTTKSFPNDEKFGLISQLRSASVSIPSNISEGASRNSNKDFNRFLIISLGSCYKIETQLLLSCDLGYINGKEFEKLNNTLHQIIKMMSRFS
jgi:four helix bundle protein